jgi:hypothetical protein
MRGQIDPCSEHLQRVLHRRDCAGRVDLEDESRLLAEENSAHAHRHLGSSARIGNIERVAYTVRVLSGARERRSFTDSPSSTVVTLSVASRMETMW